jgi:hypothetical protein
VLLIGRLSQPAVGEEQAEEFLKGLRARGLEELALDYLNQAEVSRLVAPEFRRRIPYHRGMTLLALMRRSADAAARAKWLDEARKELEQFAAANPKSVEAAEAQLQLGGVFVELARRQLGQAGDLPPEAAYDLQREKLRGEARNQLTQAGGQFERVAKIYAAELERSTAAAESDDTENEGLGRREYRARLAHAQYLLATTKFDTAPTYEKSSPVFRQIVQSAAQEFASLADQYSSSLIWGHYARLDEGRSYQALGDHQLALGCYQEVISRTSVLPAFRALTSKAYAHQAECLIAQQNLDGAIDTCRKWLSSAQSDEEKQADWLAVRFQLAEALRQKGKTLADGSPEARRILAEARDAYRRVAGVPGIHQSAARSAVAELRREGGNERTQPRTFAEAYELGKEALSAASAAQQVLAAGNGEEASARAELQRQVEEGNDDAEAYLGLALSLVGADTELSAVNDVRYFLAWLHLQSGDNYRAAVLGHFLARRYAEHPAASSAARIALAAYDRLQQESGDNEFAARRAVELAEFVSRRWPESEDADAALGVLVHYAIRNNRVEDAERMLADVGEGQRPRLELQLGMAMWVRYLQLSQQEGEQQNESLAKLKSAAIGYLKRGADAARTTKQISESSAVGAIYLAQALVSEEQNEAAIQLLEEPEFGPLSLIARRHPAVSSPEYLIQAYETALRAYVAASPPRADKVVEIVGAIEKAAAASDSQIAEQLTRVYVTLGAQLERQIDESLARDRLDEASRLSAALAQFLNRIADRRESIAWNTRQWLAQSYYRLGTSRASSSGEPPPGAPAAQREFIKKARGILEELLASVGSANPPPDGTALLTARFQLGECYRELGDYEKALDTFSIVLKEKGSSLAVQRAAALAYQQRGEAEGPYWLERAINGGYTVRSTGENLVWGWLKLSHVADRAARSDEKYREAFFEARLEMARCRFLIAQQESGETKQQDLAHARQSIQSVARLYPEFGGKNWKPRFEALLKQINEELERI